MTNPIIPEAEVTAVKKVIEAVEELKELHKELHKDGSTSFNDSEDALDRIHILAYLHFLKGLIRSSGAIKELLEVSREDFEKDATNNGEMKISKVLERAMIFGLLDTLK